MTNAAYFEKATAPKSDQLNAENLLVAPITVKILAVKEGTSEQPYSIEISGHKPFKPCKTMIRLLGMMWGPEGVEWVGRSMTLYRDPAVVNRGETVGGIRISHMSHIDGPKTVMLSESKNKRKPYTVQPLNAHPTKKDSNVMLKWRPVFKDASEDVRAIADKIRIAFTTLNAGFSAEIDADVQSITDDSWRIKLTDFASDVAAEIDAAGN